MTYEQFIFKNSCLARKINKEEEAVKLLLMENSGYSATELYLNYSKIVPEDIKSKTLSELELYFFKNKPVQYIIGHTYFYGLKIQVREGVLIPRAETELLVERLLEEIDGILSPQILDLGTGSGAIALALKKMRNDAIIMASDISDTALFVAKSNAKEHGLNIVFKKSNLFENINASFDILVSNPPYLDKDDDEIDSLVKENEPAEALFAKQGGLYFYEEILSKANRFLKKSNLIVFETPENKDQELIDIVKKYCPEAEFEILKDHNNLSRILMIKNYWRK